MADETMNDIWNDAEGEESTREKPRRGRRALIFGLTLVLVLGIVLIAAWRDGTGFDVLKRWVSYGGSAAEQGYTYDAAESNRFAVLGDALVVLSDTELSLQGQGGKVLWSTSVQMTAPALSTGGDRAVAYDVGGTELYVLNASGEEFHLTADEAEPFISASLNGSGYLAVTSEKRTYKGSVSVYNENLELIFEFKSSDRFVTDAYVSEDNKTLAAVTLGQEDSVFVSNIVLYDLGKTDPVADYDIADGLVLEIGQQDGRLVTVSDTCLTYANKNGEVSGTYTYSGEFLREYSFHGNGFATLLLNRYQSGSVGRLVTVDQEGNEVASLDVNEEVRGLSTAGKYIAVLYMDELVVYTEHLEEYARNPDTEHVKDVIIRPDGSVVLLEADKASLYLL